MNPFYFGDSRARLFGVYHPQRANVANAAAAVLCYPMGSEYMRAHRAFRQLTNLLVRGGVHVMRFDYFGTGDSAGAGEDATIERWVADVGTAAEELKENSNATRVSLIGLRFGATLAALASVARADVDRLILWDPVVSGFAYLEELRPFAMLPPAPDGAPPAWPDGTVGVSGFPLTERQRAEIGAIDLAAHGVGSASRIDIITSSERDDCRQYSLALAAAGKNASYSCVPSEGNWAEGDAFGSALIPQDIIQAVVSRMLEEVSA